METRKYKLSLVLACQSLPNYKAVARLLVDGQALRPVEFVAPPPRQV